MNYELGFKTDLYSTVVYSVISSTIFHVLYINAMTINLSSIQFNKCFYFKTLLSFLLGMFIFDKMSVLFEFQSIFLSFFHLT